MRQGDKPAMQMRLAQGGRRGAPGRAAAARRRGRGDARCASRATHLQRSRWITTVAHAVHQARGVVQDLAEASGASAHFQQHALQRALRDVSVAACHGVFDIDAHREVYGKLLLGKETPGALY